jgi:hypothetical protein
VRRLVLVVSVPVAMAVAVTVAVAAVLPVALVMLVALAATGRDDALRQELHAALRTAVRLVARHLGVHRADVDGGYAFRRA